MPTSTSRPPPVLREIHDLLRTLERIPTESPLPRNLLEGLASRLRDLATHEDIYVAKLATYVGHLRPDMSRRLLVDLLVPVERALDRWVRDDDFIPIRARDHEAVRGELRPLRLVLDHWRSAFNVGSVLRSAEGLGLEGLDLIGYTPAPDVPAVEKTALGAHVAWRSFATWEDALTTLRSEEFHLIGLETSPTARSIYEPLPKQKTALVLGNERFGLSANALKDCDELRELPLIGKKNSLNAAVVAAMAAGEWIRQWTS